MCGEHVQHARPLGCPRRPSAVGAAVQHRDGPRAVQARPRRRDTHTDAPTQHRTLRAGNLAPGVLNTLAEHLVPMRREERQIACGTAGWLRWSGGAAALARAMGRGPSWCGQNGDAGPRWRQFDSIHRGACAFGQACTAASRLAPPKRRCALAPNGPPSGPGWGGVSSATLINPPLGSGGPVVVRGVLGPCT
jgi:hypothetical protein